MKSRAEAFHPFLRLTKKGDGGCENNRSTASTQVEFFRSTLMVWALLSVMIACLVLWAFTGTAQFILVAVLSGLGVLYVVLFADL